MRRLAAIAVALLAAACDEGNTEPEPFVVRSAAFLDGTTIPKRHTCDGDGVSPPLVFEDIPSGAVSFAVTMEDLDPSEGMVTHWLLWGIDRANPTVAEGAADGEPPGEGMAEGANDGGGVGYEGPCPPEGEEHRYAFRAYALGGEIDLPSGASRSSFDAAIADRVVGYGEIRCLYRSD